MGEIADRLPPEAEQAEDGHDRPLKLAIVGRPNAGKSTLINRLLGEERMITGPEPGLTRDAVASRFSDAEGEVEIVDTAGMRKRARVEQDLERMSVSASIEALKMAEVVVLCIDATLGVEEQDLQIARLVEREGRACVIALNKWDAVEDRDAARKQVTDRLETSLAQMKGIPVVTFSALTGRGNRPPDAGGPEGPRHLEHARPHRRTEPLVRRRAGPPSSAFGIRPPAEAALCDPGQGQTADLHRFRHAL